MRDVPPSHPRALTRRCVATLLITLIALACSPDSLVGNGELPPNITDPAVTHTPAGAMNAYRGALTELSTAFAGFADAGSVHSASVVMTTGLLSDELQSGEALGSPRGTVPLIGSVFVDSRTLPENTDPVTEPASTYQTTYNELQKARGQANEAAGLLAAYVPASARTLTGHLETMQGFAELMLADVFCSGIPLSTVDYNGDYTLQSGSSTQEVYEHAITLFDSAIVAAADSARVVNLARVGKGRALLDLGRFAEAAQAVADVPDGFQYLETYSAIDQTTSGDGTNFVSSVPGYTWTGSVSDREGGHGLDFITSGDPRVGATPTGGTNPYGFTIELPTKYAPSGDTPVVLADWIEARLIQAEAQLQAGEIPAWLGTLNHLRETAINPAIADTTDPVDADARVNLHFRERAFWLFLTGHRLGDLRRLVRQYGRNANAVFPTGPYSGANGSYGSDVNAPIPAAERAYNPRFTGCINRGA
jgi:hypothetical protein